MDPAIRIEGLWKEYVLGGARRSGTLYETFGKALRAPLRRFRELAGTDRERERFWALRDLSLEVPEGEVLGVIGRNGAGKSTLLKILTRITDPTRGRIEIRGRVSSLLEVGTGFHPELTGRENIYLNGAILGMTRREIARRFDEIVAFAEIEKFLDTPVKRYSSGMYVRLAFAVAAHLEPDVLLVDEVLAVGDAAFQRKCLSKMGDVRQEGRTILFVSHNMTAIQSLCTRVLWLHGGELRRDGATAAVTTEYLSSTRAPAFADAQTATKARVGNDLFLLSGIRLEDPRGNSSGEFGMSMPFRVVLEFALLRAVETFHLTLHFRDERDIVAFTTSTKLPPDWSASPDGRTFKTECCVPGNLLNSGTYRLTLLAVRDGQVSFELPDAHAVTVLEDQVRDSGYYGREPGVLQPKLDWNVSFVGE